MQRAKRYKKRKLSKKKVIVAAAALLAVIAIIVTSVVLIVNAINTKTFTVIFNNTVEEERSTYRIETTDDYLSDALLNRGLIVGGEHDVVGFVIEKADGDAVDHTKYQCWAIHVNGNRGEQDASKIKVKDNDIIEIRLEYLQ